MENQTPKTDKAATTTDWASGESVVPAVFARSLERENALLRTANTDVARIATERNQMEAALRNLMRRHEEEIDGGEPISGEEWEIASYALPANVEERDAGRLCAKLREQGHEDEAQAIALIDYLMREYALADDLLTLDAIDLRDELMGIAANWANLPND